MVPATLKFQHVAHAPVAASARAWSFNGENGIFVRNGRVRARVRVLNQPQRDKVHRKKAASIAAAATDALRLYHLDTWRPRVRLGAIAPRSASLTASPRAFSHRRESIHC